MNDIKHEKLDLESKGYAVDRRTEKALNTDGPAVVYLVGLANSRVDWLDERWNGNNYQLKTTTIMFTC